MATGKAPRPTPVPCRPCKRAGLKKGPCPHPWRIVAYAACPDCSNWSLGVRANGRFVRHSIGFGHVENAKMLKKRGWRTTVCEGSGKPASVTRAMVTA